MFYCEPCRRENQWPEALASSFGRCEVCGEEKSCYDKPSSTLPLPQYDDLYDSSGNPVPARAKDRVDEFLELFTEEERNAWAGKHKAPPNWVVLAVSYFLGEGPARKELFRRLKESGD